MSIKSRVTMRCLFIFLNTIGFTGGLKAQAPVITSFSPASAIPGASVTLTGTGFNTTTTNNIVFFGATMATVTAASATSITATVPTSASYAPITLLNTGTVLACASLSNFNPIYSPAKASFNSDDLSAKVDFTTGSNTKSLAIGDLDGDGKADLAVVCAGSASVSVFRNTSSSGSIASGSFATKVDFTTGTSPEFVVIRDLDGDGKADLAVVNASSSISVFRNTSSSGTVSFATKVDFTTGYATQPNSIAVGDLDGDGKPEVVTGNYLTHTVSVFRNTSSSGTIDANSFATKVDFTTGTNPQSSAIGDLDGDGKPDLAVVNSTSNTVSVFRNTASSGAIDANTFAAKVDFQTGSAPLSLAIGDLNGDGKADLAVANDGSNNVSVIRNTSSSGTIDANSFATKVDFATRFHPRSLAIGDLNGDGKADLAVASLTSSIVSVFRNTVSSGTVSFATRVDFTTGNPGNTLFSIAVGDLDGDGKPEVVTANSSLSTVSVFRNADGIWNGSVNTDWSTAANWTPNAVPAVGQPVVIPTGLTNYPAVPSDRTISSLSLASGASLNLNSNTLTLTSNLSNAGSITGAGKLTMGGSSAQSISGTGTVSNLEVNNSTGVTITSGAGNMQRITGVLTPTAGTLTINGNLTLKSSASGTARVAAVPASGAAITGNVTVERYLPLGRKWRMLTAPLTGSSNNNVFYNWQNSDVVSAGKGVEIWGPGGVADPSSSNDGLALGGGASMRSYGSSGWAPVTSTNSTLLFDNTTNYGYALFATGPYNNGSTTYIGGPGSLPAAAATTLSATGSLITGDHTKNFTATSAGQYFLVGNPYASPVDPRSFTETPTANRTNLNAKLWMWDAKPGNGVGNGLGRYVSFDLSSNAYSVPGNGYADNNVMIQSGQAFFVQAPAVGAASLVFRETSKDANGSHAMMGNEIRTAKSLLRLTLQQPVTADSTENLDGAVAVFHADGKAGLDPLDGSKLMNSSENIFFCREERSLTFEHRPLPGVRDTLRLRMANMLARGYTLQVEATDFPDMDGLSAELRDRFTGKSTPISLKGVTDHSFTVTADSLSTSDRFEVVFRQAAAPVTVIPDTDGGDVLKLYPNPVREKLKVAVQLSTSGPFGLQVFDASGSEVWRRTGIAAGTKTVEVNTAGLRKGVYTLRLTDAKGETRAEKFVRE